MSTISTNGTTSYVRFVFFSNIWVHNITDIYILSGDPGCICLTHLACVSVAHTYITQLSSLNAGAVPKRARTSIVAFFSTECAGLSTFRTFLAINALRWRSGSSKIVG